jgi:hypothetical protein
MIRHHENSRTIVNQLSRSDTGWIRRLLAAAVVMVLVGPWALGVDLRRRTVDGGGEMFSSNGVFQLSGTIGQPDARSLTGGPFSVHGGFWFSSPEADCDADGGVNLGDFPLLNTCLVGPFGGFEVTECQCYDLDGDKDVDLADMSLFAAAFDGG